ncbi:MAG TPA: hypothetical protein VGQ34_13060 [Sphingomicrobium sp.]|nr:hypothetical protein [Sphingomicrobium sp.]
MKSLALLMVLPLLAACNVHSKNPASGDENVSVHADENGHISFNLPIGQGQLKLPTSMMHNGNFDIDGVKLPPGSSVNGFNLDAHDKGATVDMSFTNPKSPDEVRSYFIDQFKNKGVEASLSGDSVTGKSKDGSSFTIEVSSAAGGSQGKIVVQDKD